GGISGATRVHGSSVRSEGYIFRNWSCFNVRAHSSAEGICANSLTNTSFCQALFPDSLLQQAQLVWRSPWLLALLQRRRRRPVHDFPLTQAQLKRSAA